MQPTPSLSVLYPVHNSENLLDQRLHELLEVLPELTSQFEIVVVDDASQDETTEVARELSMCYPQISVYRHRVGLGVEATLRSALGFASGDVLFVRDAACQLNLHELPKLWRRMDRCDFVFGRGVPATGKSGLTRIVRPTSESFDPQQAFQLLKRRAVGRVQWPAAQGRTLLGEIASQGYAYEVVYLVHRQADQPRIKAPMGDWLSEVRSNSKRMAAGQLLPARPELEPLPIR
jgi:cellulose synthase/poly-beta-1,6-N-acetylglucosamine synthase-like glycosyltransferase